MKTKTLLATLLMGMAVTVHAEDKEQFWADAFIPVAQYAKENNIKYRLGVSRGNKEETSPAVTMFDEETKVCTFVINVRNNSAESFVFNKIERNITSAEKSAMITAIWFHEMGHCEMYLKEGVKQNIEDLEEGFADIFSLETVKIRIPENYKLTVEFFNSIRKYRFGDHNTREFLEKYFSTNIVTDTPYNTARLIVFGK